MVLLVLSPFSEEVYKFPVESKSDFSDDSPLRGYDPCKEDYSRCMHGKDCLVQMCAEETDGGRCFFKCPQAWVILTSTSLLNMVLLFRICNTTLLLQSYTAQRTASLLGGSIRLQFIRIRSTFITFRIVSSI